MHFHMSPCSHERRGGVCGQSIKIATVIGIVQRHLSTMMINSVVLDVGKVQMSN